MTRREVEEYEQEESAPVMIFDFADADGHLERLCFERPERIVAATTLREVLPALREIERWVGQGRYAAGYLAYEAAPAFDPRMEAHLDSCMPLVYFGIFREPVRGERQQDQAGPSGPDDRDVESGEMPIPQWDCLTKEAEYAQAIRTIKDRIAQGETYQVNYTVRLQASLELNPDWLMDGRPTDSPRADQASGECLADSLCVVPMHAASKLDAHSSGSRRSPAARPVPDSRAQRWYERLLDAQQPDYGAYLELGDYRILSASPELFFRLRDGRITTKPMKGTMPRGLSAEADEANRRRLAESEKDRAENLMIVDLMRNDLARIAKTGSVRVPELFAVEAYPTVFQMTSTVTAELRDGVTLPELFRALFPCGSITGAPKLSTMSIIRELEPAPREVYCGSIGFLAPGGEAVFNVAIRTLLLDSEKMIAQYGVGGGITWESTEEGEYREAMAKAAILRESAVPGFDLFETLRSENGHLLHPEDHLARMKRSAAYFGFPYEESKARRVLGTAAEQGREGIWRIKLVLDRQGRFRTETMPFTDLPPEMRAARLADVPIDSGSRFLYHKTTNRRLYDRMQRTKGDCFDVLMWNERRELTVFTIGTLVVKRQGEYLTPPVRCGLLPGTMRSRLIREGRIREAVLPLDCLPEFEEIWFVNSLRGWIPIRLERSAIYS